MRVLELRPVRTTKGLRYVPLGSGLGEITAETKPDNPDSWNCSQWVVWHKALKKVYGRGKANDIWRAAWEGQSFWDYQKNFCKYEEAFVSYFLAEGIDTRSWLSAIVTPVAEAAADIADGAGGAVKGAARTVKGIGFVLPAAAALALGGVGYYIYKNYIKGDKRVKTGLITV